MMQRIASILCCIISFAAADRVVMTDNGPVQGITVATGEREVEAFLGIPYAEPPIGRLRFRKPVPKTSWMGVYDASRQPPTCMQNVTEVHFGNETLANRYYEPSIENMTEDCLFLSLWVPYSKVPSTLKPIILFTHGGAFNIGSGNMEIYDGTNLAKFGDVIVVNFNYRVGAFGFFAAFIEDADGNMGIYDYLLALKWVRNNAKYFGGDPDNIILMGESAGAMITGGHLTSPLTKGLFKRVIMQSGAPTFPMILDDNEKLYQISQQFASILGCADKTLTLKDNPSLVVQCLKRLPADDLVKAEGRMKQMNPITFFPRTGDAYVPKPVIHLLQEGHFYDAEMLVGVNELEGSFFLSAAAPQYFGVYGVNRISSISKRLAYQMTRLIFKNLNQKNEKEIATHVINGIENGSADIYTEEMAKALGDYLITCDAYYQAEYHSMRNPVFFYVFTRRPSVTPLADWMKVTHFDELAYVFGNPLFGNFTPEEIALSEKIMSRWVAFAKTGNPNVPGMIRWPEFTREDPEYLRIDEEESVHFRPDEYRCEFWRERFDAHVTNEIVSKIKRSVNVGIFITANHLLIITSITVSYFSLFRVH